MDKLLRWRAEVGGRTLTGVVDGPDGAVRIHCNAPAGTIQKITAVLPWEMEEDERAFFNGYQTWTCCPEYGRRDKIRGLAHVPRPLLDKYAFDLYFAEGSESEVFDGWFSAMGVKPRTDKKLAGYSSWYNRYQDIDQDAIRSDLAGCRSLLQPGDLFQVDDGWEPQVGDWLEADSAKFPGGMKSVAEEIHGAGFLAGLWLAPFGTKTESRAGRMIRAMELLREWCGDKLILGCGVPLMPAYGLVDYCRVGCDVGLDWDDVWYMRLFHRERVSTKQAIGNTIFRRQLNGRAWLNDPDVFFLREENVKLSSGQKDKLARVNALLGGVLLTSDNPAGYSPAAREQYRALRELSRAENVHVDADQDPCIIYTIGDREFQLSLT